MGRWLHVDSKTAVRLGRDATSASIDGSPCSCRLCGSTPLGGDASDGDVFSVAATGTDAQASSRLRILQELERWNR